MLSGWDAFGRVTGADSEGADAEHLAGAGRRRWASGRSSGEALNGGGEAGAAKLSGGNAFYAARVGSARGAGSWSP